MSFFNNLICLDGMLRGRCLDLLQSDMPSWRAQGTVVESLQSDMPSWLAQGSVVKSYNLTCLDGMLRGRWLNVFFNNLTRLAGMLRVGAWIFTI